MAFDLKRFQKELAQQKVYDTWQYVNSLREMLTYMNMSCELLDKVYTQRGIKLEEKEQEILRKAVKTGKPVEIITDPEEIKEVEDRARVFLHDVFAP